MQIGQGTYSTVYKARDLTDQKIVALKRVRFDNCDAESVKFMAREILVLRRLDHPNVIKLEGLITSQTSRSLYLVFEYMEHDLTGLASSPSINFSEPQVVKISFYSYVLLFYMESRFFLLKCNKTIRWPSHDNLSFRYNWSLTW